MTVSAITKWIFTFYFVSSTKYRWMATKFTSCRPIFIPVFACWKIC